MIASDSSTHPDDLKLEYLGDLRLREEYSRCVQLPSMAFSSTGLETLHTFPGDALISVTRPNSTRRFSHQNTSSRSCLPFHLTKISVLQVQVLDEGTKISHLRLDLMSKTDDQAVQTIIRGFSPWHPLRC
ncbi:hypothetical protein TNCV_988681 [Trichonephila clavipes]|nr:hypothetical protein TNCV_988681 [Trichonephila clavipes]